MYVTAHSSKINVYVHIHTRLSIALNTHYVIVFVRMSATLLYEWQGFVI